MDLLKLIACLACLLIVRAAAQEIVADANPSARALASLLIDKASFKLIESGPHAPTFSGPLGSAKIIKSWTVPANALEKKYLPGGAVKLQTVEGAKGKSVVLKFSATSKVRERESSLQVSISSGNENHLKWP
jgi:hypothetical protein